MDKKLKTKPPHIVEDHLHVKPYNAHFHIKHYKVKGHYTTLRNGKKKWIPAHQAVHHVKVYHVSGKEFSREELRFGGHSKEVFNKIFEEEKKKHPNYSEKKLKEIAGGAVGKIYRHKIANAYKH